MKSSHYFAGNSFNRLAHRRDDTAWLQQQLQDGNVQVLPLWRGKVLITNENNTPRMISINHAEVGMSIGNDQLILLGEFRKQLYFATELSGDTTPNIHATAQFHDLRGISGLLHRDEAGMLGYARALLHWHSIHRFCGRCGSINKSIKAGHVLECSNASCKQQTFPRLDPAVIVLITDGERILLGRQARFPPGRYSTIAGFVEWAESIEEAVIREVREETSIIVDEVHYHSSQPWPFPSSLMLGFVAHALTTTIELTDNELEDARWFSRIDIADGKLRLPPTQSISFRLIENWYDGNSMRPLMSEPAALIDRTVQVFNS